MADSPTPIPEPVAPASASNPIPTAGAKDVNPQNNPVLVTSAASRTNYANNVNTLNTATNNINPSGTSGMVMNGGVLTATPPSYDNATGKLTDYGKSIGAKDVNGTTDRVNGVSQNPNVPNADGTAYGSTSKSTASSTDSNTPDSNGMVKTSDGLSTTPELRDAYDTSLRNLDAGIAQAKSNLQQALSTLQNDPAATNAINMIMAKYDQQIEAMKAKNRVLLGSNVVNAARGGGLQYANEITTNFMSEEQDKASQRVTDLVSLESSKIMEATAAYKKGDVAAFDAASKALDKANADKSKAINDLLTHTDKIVKEQQAQAKIDAAASKQKITDDIRISTSLGVTVAKAIADSGIKDEKQINAYIEGMANKSGISNPDILRSAVTKAQQTQTKLDLSSANITDTIANRDKRTQIAAGKKAVTDTKTKTIKFDKPTSTALYGAGLSGSDVTVLGQAIYQYGAQTVIDNPKLSDPAKTILEGVYGLTRTK